MKFEEAIKLLKEGKKVRRKSWDDKKGFWIMQDDCLKSSGGYPSMCFDNFTATDWEVVGEDDDWNVIKEFKEGLFSIKYLDKGGSYPIALEKLKAKILEDIEKLGKESVWGIADLRLIIDGRFGF